MAFCNPDVLDEHARKLSRLSEQVRDAASRHETRARTTHWISTAADACRANISEDVRAAHEVADELDRSAAALHRHAQTVRERLEEIRRAEEAVTGWFEDQAERVRNGIEGAAQDMERAVRSIQLPPPGDPKWLLCQQHAIGMGMM